MLHLSRSNFRFHIQPQGSPVYSSKLDFRPSALESSSSSWATTRKNLVSKWRIQARQFRHKRGVAGSPPTLTGALTRPSDWIGSAHVAAARVKTFESESGTGDHPLKTLASICPLPGISGNIISVDHSNTESTSRASNYCCVSPSYFEDFNQDLSDLDRDLQYIIDPMEKRKSARVAEKSSSRHSDGKGLTTGQLSPEQFLAAKKQEAIAIVMAVFNQWLDKRLSVITYAYEASDGSQEAPDRNTTSHGSNPSRYGSDGSGRARAKRQLSSDGDDVSGSSSGGGDGDGHDENNRGGNKRAKKDAEEKRLFACPFFQHDPKHCTHRSCTGPGWPTIHRLKEHLNRTHRLPKHMCPRCREPWADAGALEMHLRSDIACVKRDVVRLQGIDDAQEKKLKERKKTSGSMTEEQKWRDIYMILFPTANNKALPSPYYDSRDSVTFAKSAAQWKKLRKHIQKELPEAVQKRVEQRFEGVEAELLYGLSDIVRDEIFHILKGFPQGASAPASPGPASRSPTPRVPDAPATFASTAIATSGALNLDPFTVDDSGINLLTGFSDVDFDQQFSFGAECFSDSGYNSVSTVSAPTGDSFDTWTC